MLGFSEHQITQVLNNLLQIFTMSDVYNAVEIWDKRHAEKILSVINSLFGDILPGEHFHDMRREFQMCASLMMNFLMIGKKFSKIMICMI